MTLSSGLIRDLDKADFAEASFDGGIFLSTGNIYHIQHHDSDSSNMIAARGHRPTLSQGLDKEVICSFFLIGSFSNSIDIPNSSQTR
jgi:hypothetical protein